MRCCQLNSIFSTKKTNFKFNTTLKRYCNYQGQLFLLSPLCLVLNSLMNIFSLVFRNRRSGLKIFSKIVTSISFPVALVSFLLDTYPLLRKSSLEGPVHLSYVLLWTFLTWNAIDCIICLAINWLVDCHYCITCSGLHRFTFFYKRADGASVAFFHYIT